MTIATQRLILRSWIEDDAESLYTYAKDPDIGPIAGWPVHTSIENSRETIRYVLAVPETYAVTLKDCSGLTVAPNAAIGSAGILIGKKSNLQLPENEAEIGYWIGKSFWGQGFIPEAVSALLRHAFDDLNLTCLWCTHFDGNENSKHVIEKCGFTFVRTDENKSIPLIDAIRTLYIYRITKAEWEQGYRIIRPDQYYRKDVFNHFSNDCKCSTSITHSITVTPLLKFSKRTGSKFYINFLYILCKVLNARDDYRMQFDWKTGNLMLWNRLNPIQYIFSRDTETCTPVYSAYTSCYADFYHSCQTDIAKAKTTRSYNLDAANHPNWFDASFISWINYSSLNIELPDGYLHFLPIINWGRYQRHFFTYTMPVTVRLNHAIADGYLVADVFIKLEKEIRSFCGLE